MKHILKYLTVANFLILCLPFLQTCKKAEEASVSTDFPIIIDSTFTIDTVNISNNKQIIDSSITQTDSNFTQSQVQTPDKSTWIELKEVIFPDYERYEILNGYQFVFKELFNEFDEIKLTIKFSVSFLFDLSKLLIILIPSIKLILALQNRIKFIPILSFLTIILLTFSIYCLAWGDFWNIKIGFYLLVINLVAEIYYGLKLKSKEKRIN